MNRTVIGSAFLSVLMLVASCDEEGGVGSKCSQDLQCNEGLFCGHGTCERQLAEGDDCDHYSSSTACMEGLFCLEDDGICTTGRQGSPCDTHADCVETGVSCIDGICLMNSGCAEFAHQDRLFPNKDMAACSGDSPIYYSSADTTCAPGWHSCSYSEYQARLVGRSAPKDYWLDAYCIMNWKLSFDDTWCEPGFVSECGSARKDWDCYSYHWIVNTTRCMDVQDGENMDVTVNANVGDKTVAIDPDGCAHTLYDCTGSSSYAGGQAVTGETGTGLGASSVARCEFCPHWDGNNCYYLSGNDWCGWDENPMYSCSSEGDAHRTSATGAMCCL